MKRIYCRIIAPTLVVITLFCALGCSNGRGDFFNEHLGDDSLFKTICIDFDVIQNNSGKPYGISAIADTVTYIPLETNDSLIIGNIRRLVVINDTMYIWDDTSDEVFLFNSFGRYISKISKKGRADDEYVRIMDFFVNPKSSNIYIYSDANQSIYEYNSQAKLLSKIDIPFTIRSFAVLDDFTSYYSGVIPNGSYDEGSIQYSYRGVYQGNVNCQLPFYFFEDLLRLPSSNNNFTFYNDTLLLTDYITAKTYKIFNDSKLVPQYSIKFTSNLIEIDYNSKVSFSDIREAQRSGTYVTLHNSFYENDRYIFFNFSRGIVGLGIINKVENKTYCEYILVDDFNNNTLNTSISYVDSAYMYKIAEPHMLLRKLGNKKLKLSSALTKQIKEMSEFDNPVVVKVKLK